MNVNVLSKTRRLASITDFYCNKRVNILTRIKSFARRIRFHCKLHNQILYGNDNKLVGQNKYKITEFIIEDLVAKSSFLSNHDSILILDILSRIKIPLERISSKTNVSYLSEETDNNNNNDNNNINYNNNIKFGTISRIISRGQTSLLKYLIKSEESMTLTNNERYYLIIALSRDCGLISFSTWMKLFENVYDVLITKGPDSLYGHKPYEISNLLLIYDQISRWSYKRQNNNNNNNNKSSNILKDKQENKYNEEINESKSIENYSQLKKLENELDVNKDLERRTYNPFNLDIINIGISRLEKCIEQIKREKIIKILYLANSRNIYSNNLFQNTLIHFESENMLESFELSEIYTLFNLFSRSYYYQLLSHIESFIYYNNISEQYIDKLNGRGPTNLIGNVIKGTLLDNRNDNGSHYINDNGNVNGNSYINSLDDEVYKYNKSESMFLCTIIISLEYVRRIFRMDKGSKVLGKYEIVSDRIHEIFGKDLEWRDILTFLENRIKNIENISKDKIDITYQQINQRQVREFIEKINTFRKINEYLLRLINNDRKYENRSERIKYCIKLLDYIIQQATHSLTMGDSTTYTINQQNIPRKALNTIKTDVEIATI